MCRAEQYFDSSLRRWIEAVARNECWRVKQRMSWEDLAAEGYLCFAKCWNKYHDLFDVDGPTLSQRKHLCKLVQVSFINHIRTLAKKSQRTMTFVPYRALQKSGGRVGSGSRVDVEPGVDGTETQAQALERQFPVLPAQELCCALARAPEEITDLLRKLGQDSVEAITSDRYYAQRRKAVKKVLAFVQT